MKEELLHFVWRLRRFAHDNLLTTEGQGLEILQVGTHNPDAGPDFSDARIRIGDTLWAGNVEIHLLASDWEKHQHQNDAAYDNVILHVVLEEDQPILRKNGVRIPCLELKSRISSRMAAMYLKLQHNEHWIPCQHQFYQAPEITRNLWLDRLLVERLEQRTYSLQTRLARNKFDWEETFYQLLGRSFGVKVNVEPFDQLVRGLPLLILHKHKNNLFQIEALLFGQAGLLGDNLVDSYPKRLREEYLFLQKKYQLIPMLGNSWKFLRMRPANFPSIRIAQFATLIYQSVHLLSKVLVIQNVQEIENMLEVQLSNYWQTHYLFDRASAKRRKRLGKNAVHLLIINTIVPFLFFYGKHKGEQSYKDLALQLLEELHPEDNNVIKKWETLGVTPKSAYQSQALLQLKNEYCAQHKCLQCAVGTVVLSAAEG